jgi:predicted nucleic acid-binding protein
MIFARLGSGERVFLDANTLVYHFEPHPVLGGACNVLLQRIDQQDVFGFTSTHVLSEVAHRLMVIEAANLPGWTAAKAKNRLQQQPGVIQNLTQFRRAIETVLNSRIQALSISPALILAAASVSQSYGLLSSAL